MMCGSRMWPLASTAYLEATYVDLPSCSAMILTSRGGPDCATTSSDAGPAIMPWRVSGDVPTTTVPGSPSNLSVNGVSSDCGPRQAMVSPALTVHESDRKSTRLNSSH